MTAFFEKSYKNTRTKKGDGLCHPLFWYAGRMDSKGRHQCAHWCNKQSGGLFVSPWESPSDSRRIRYGCGWEPNRAIKRISRYPFGYLLFGLSGGTRRSECECPVDIHLPPVSTAATRYGVFLKGNTPAASPFRHTPSGAWQTDAAHQKSRYCSQTETWTYCGLSV